MRYISTLLLTFLLALIACKKQRNEPSPQDRLLGKWKLTGALLKAGNFTRNIYEELKNCEKDNIFEFRINGVLIIRRRSYQMQPQQPTTNF